MIDYKNLNDTSPADILTEYKKQIGYLTSEWTNQQESDPGITLIELFAWLKSVQHEYLNRMSNGVRRKFLELLSIKPMKNCGAKAFITVTNLSRDLAVPLHTKWHANKMIFENFEIVNLTKAKILSVDFENKSGEETKRVSVEKYKFDGNKVFNLFGNDLKFFNSDIKRSFTINFDDSLPSGCVIGIYFNVHLDKGLHRIPILPGQKFDEIASVSYEYYTTKNFKNGWEKLQVIEDQTHNFLYPGLVKFKITDTMVADKNGFFKIRVKLSKSDYDFPPKITDIFLNTFEVTQNDCLCDSIILKKKDFHLSEDESEYLAEIQNHLAIYGKHFLYTKNIDAPKSSWLPNEDFSYTRDIENNKLILKIPKTKFLFDDFTDEDEIVNLICCEKKIQKDIILGNGTGTSQQYVDFDSKGVLDGGVEVLVGEKVAQREYFFTWTQADDFFSSSKYDRHFVFNTERGMMIFGDHQRGQAPKIGENNIRLCKLNRCVGADSNIKEGLINAVITENAALKNAKVTSITGGFGGRNSETFEHAEQRASESLTKINRAVSLDDYYKIVKSTPGIVFKNIKILPNFMKNTDSTMQNCVTIAINCHNHVGAKLPECYKKNVLRQIEKFRLINTRISVIGVEYIGIILSGELCTNSYFIPKEKAVEKEVEKFFEKLNKEMGRPLIFGDIFGSLDRLRCVNTVNSLNIVPLGKFIEKTSCEDIIIPPNGIYYVKKMDFHFVKGNDILV